MHRALVYLLALSMASIPALAQAPSASGSPEAAYRAYWNAAPDLADSAALAPYLTAARLEEYRERAAENPELVERAAVRQSARFERMRIAELQTIKVEGDSATLRVRFEDSTAPGAQAGGLIEMRRENGHWRIHSERAERAEPGPSPARACPETFGEPGSGSTLTIRSERGTREAHFARVLVLRDDGELHVQFPRFAQNDYTLVVERFAPGAREQRVKLFGQFVSTDCLPLPSFDGASREGVLAIEGTLPHEQGGFEATLSIPHPQNAEWGFFGRVSGDMLDIGPKPVSANSTVVVGGTAQPTTRGTVHHRREQQLLEVRLGTETRMPVSSASLMDFTGSPGVYLAKPCVGFVCEPFPEDRTLLAIVQEFGDGRMRAEVRDIPRSALTDPLPDPAAAARLGSLRARFETDHVVEIPELPPIG